MYIYIYNYIQLYVAHTLPPELGSKTSLVFYVLFDIALSTVCVSLSLSLYFSLSSVIAIGFLCFCVFLFNAQSQQNPLSFIFFFFVSFLNLNGGKSKHFTKQFFFFLPRWHTTVLRNNSTIYPIPVPTTQQQQQRQRQQIIAAHPHQSSRETKEFTQKST